ncbi:MAG: hypothetical protein OES32_06175 [Acidobacteriota bacterium]|nr:hypothetical protein [Acidobacteriota bacterium]
MLTPVSALAALTFALLLALFSWPANGEETRFTDTFDGDLSGWQLVGAQAISIADSGDREHGKVLVLEPDGTVLALVDGSDAWGPVRIELDVLFPDEADNYLGLIYNYTVADSRSDFGSLYIKGNGSYIRANPWRDGNVSRLLYEEYKTRIEGDDAIRIGQWQKVKAEVLGSVCHLYVGDMTTPKVTFGLYEGTDGMVGVNPRVAGWPVWIDNVRVTSIDALSYRGPDIPALTYEPERLVTNWEVIGPLPQPEVEIERERNPGAQAVEVEGDSHAWRPFEVDARGAVITGRVTEYDGSRPVAYFRTVVHSDREREALLHISTTDELALWVNGRFDGFIYRNGYVFGERDWNAWHDFWKDPDHAGSEVPVTLQQGANALVIRVRNGQFASGGFFAFLADE